MTDFFEVDAQDNFTGNMKLKGGHNYIEIPNIRAVKSDQNVMPADSLPRGLVFTSGYCTEKLLMLEDARVEMVHIGSIRNQLARDLPGLI